MTISKAVTHGGLAALVLTVSMTGWSAARFSPAEQPLGSIAPIVLSNSDLSDNNTKAYRPWFENGSWQGDLVEYDVTKTGVISTSVSFAGPSPTNTGDNRNWSALVNFANKPANFWETRKIITFNGTTQVPFRFTDTGIGAVNKELLDSGAPDDDSKILNFVRGDRSNEYPNGTQLRHRTSILGSIIHSKPVYVGAPNDTRTEDEYASFANDLDERAARVYVGANDGMLHVFDAEDGEEVYAYVPSMLMDKLSLLTARPYPNPNPYYVDGEMSVRDAYFQGDWHTVLVGSLGAGGKGFYGLDITNPDLTSETSTSPDNTKVLFEFSAAEDDDLGDSFSRPVIAQLNDGKWYVVVGNGYNSVNGVATLYLVNLNKLKDPNPVIKLTTGSGTPTNPNGLSSPSLVDTDRNGTADYAYAGDIDGNLWKFDLSSESTNSWGEAYGRPLHPSAGSQAITQAPQVALHPNFGYMVYFATGRLYNDADLDDTSIQAMYGIWDSGAIPPDANSQSLLLQTWDGPKTYTDTNEESQTVVTQEIAIFNPDPGSPNWDNQNGWKIEFPAGYRMLQPVQVRANRVIATVYNPIRGEQGENWLLEAVLVDGGPNPTASPIFDLNVDQLLNTSDLCDNDPAVVDEEWHVPMLWRQADGIMSQVTIGYIRPGVDTLFINYLQQPFSEPCTTDCPKGFQSGHIDVETWLDSAPLGGNDTKHEHEYDKKAGRVYVDMFDLNVLATVGEDTPDRRDVTGQVEIDSTGTPAPSSTITANTEFIVLLANADFSPGSTLQIGTKKWNALEYQRQIHTALRNWDPTSAADGPVDSDGDSLVFTWGAIKAAGGTISHNFDDLAIRNGGLHPTNPLCVRRDATGGDRDTYNPITKVGRWRNGALTTQLVRKDYFTNGPINPAIAMVDIQKPTDLVPVVTLADGSVLATAIDYNNDLDTKDQYEEIGGLLAKSGQEHIWESTLFWHFGAIAELAGLGAPGQTAFCYGDPNWAAAVALELSDDPISAALVELGLEGVTVDTLAEFIAGLEPCNEAACNLYRKVLQALLDRADDYTIVPTDIGTSGDNEQTSNTIPGGATGVGQRNDGGVGSRTQGVDFEPGRKSWTDIVE